MSDLTSADFVRFGPQWNEEWLRGPGRDHWLATAWEVLHKQGAEFCASSCEVSAEMVRAKLTPGQKWVCREAAPEGAPLYQVSLGRGWEDCEHILTVWGEETLQSYYGKYTMRADPVTPRFLASLARPAAPGSYEVIACGVAPGAPQQWKVTYWVPVGAGLASGSPLT